jgi:hypothetical protein
MPRRLSRVVVNIIGPSLSISSHFPAWRQWVSNFIVQNTTGNRTRGGSWPWSFISSLRGKGGVQSQMTGRRAERRSRQRGLKNPWSVFFDKRLRHRVGEPRAFHVIRILYGLDILSVFLSGVRGHIGTLVGVWQLGRQGEAELDFTVHREVVTGHCKVSLNKPGLAASKLQGIRSRDVVYTKETLITFLELSVVKDLDGDHG